MIILGIETSCDETAASVIEEKNGSFSVLSNMVSSQVKLHAKWGGVVPNLAAREHLKNILPVLRKSLKKAKTSPRDIDLISVTKGPGLIPALLVGTTAAKTLAYLWEKPLLGIHHIEGHIYANFISSKGESDDKKIDFPLLCLVVSGGHTQLILMRNHLNYEIIGETLDDAAGEAFDKVARILGLNYPGGPEIAQEADKVKNGYALLKNDLPRPMLNSKDFSFSFSGLKTAVLYLTKKNKLLLKNKRFIQEVCAEFQQAVIDVLISKTIKASKKYSPKTILLAGGVSANIALRKQLGRAIKKELKNTSYIAPDPAYTVDNATMIAIAGYFNWKENKNKEKFQKTLEKNWKNLQTDANLKLK